MIQVKLLSFLLTSLKVIISFFRLPLDETFAFNVNYSLF
uniref:Uncharacterized protein n=1 Tax=Bacteriophage sp. TaxID=38018 RepID=A0A8D9PEZ1_9VIRU|nr:MAG TPA: hypothetical protein [Bacteriophage sp.]